MNEDAGEVELLLSDASAVEEKIIKTLIKLFGGGGSKSAKTWLFGSLLSDDVNEGHLRYMIQQEIDRELNRRRDEYK